MGRLYATGSAGRKVLGGGVTPEASPLLGENKVGIDVEDVSSFRRIVVPREARHGARRARKFQAVNGKNANVAEPDAVFTEPEKIVYRAPPM